MLKGLIIVCPYQHLVTQWEEECKNFNIETVTCFQNRRAWEPQLDNLLYNVQAGEPSVCCLYRYKCDVHFRRVSAEIAELSGKYVADC